MKVILFFFNKYIFRNIDYKKNVFEFFYFVIFVFFVGFMFCVIVEIFMINKFLDDGIIFKDNLFFCVFW